MKQKTRILIYILVAIAVVIMGSMAIIIDHQADEPVSAQEHIDLGRIYLVDLSYEKAVLEFTEAIEIEPLNADAYLGLAEAYIGIGDADKAIEILEEGYGKTDDDRLKNMLEELLPPDPEVTTAVTTAATTAEDTTTVSTVAMATVPDLSGLTEEEAIAACEAAGLQHSISYDYSNEVEKGYVIGQTIPVNASVTDGIGVPFTVSKGVKAVTTVTTTIGTTVPTVVETKIPITTVTTVIITSPTIVETTELTITQTEIAETEASEEFVTINGKKYSTNLTELNIYVSLTDNEIQELSKMKKLENLNAAGCIFDIDVLSELTNLKKLSLYSSQISDISALKNLTNLEELYLQNNQISDLSPLSELTNLKVLWLTGNPISDMKPLSNLTNLEELWLHYVPICDIDVLKNLTNLKKLYLPFAKVTERDIIELQDALPDCDIN